MNKKFYRSITDRKIAGVCGGIAEYFGIDPTIVRVLCAVSIICCGVGLWIYILLWLLAPER